MSAIGHDLHDTDLVDRSLTRTCELLLSINNEDHCRNSSEHVCEQTPAPRRTNITNLDVERILLPEGNSDGLQKYFLPLSEQTAGPL